MRASLPQSATFSLPSCPSHMVSVPVFMFLSLLYHLYYPLVPHKLLLFTSVSPVRCHWTGEITVILVISQN